MSFAVAIIAVRTVYPTASERLISSWPTTSPRCLGPSDTDFRQSVLSGDNWQSRGSFQRGGASDCLTATLWGAIFEGAIKLQLKSAPQRVAVKRSFWKLDSVSHVSESSSSYSTNPVKAADTQVRDGEAQAKPRSNAITKTTKRIPHFAD